MKTSRRTLTLIYLLPIISVAASATIVTHQTLRRDRLKAELASSQRKHDALEKRLIELDPTHAAAAAPDTTVEESHHHHDDE